MLTSYDRCLCLRLCLSLCLRLCLRLVEWQLECRMLRYRSSVTVVFRSVTVAHGSLRLPQPSSASVSPVAGELSEIVVLLPLREGSKSLASRSLLLLSSPQDSSGLPRLPRLPKLPMLPRLPGLAKTAQNPKPCSEAKATTRS